jgi:hypothetical protein
MTATRPDYNCNQPDFQLRLGPGVSSGGCSHQESVHRCKEDGGGIGRIGAELGECVWDRAVVVVVMLHMVRVYLLLIISSNLQSYSP